MENIKLDNLLQVFSDLGLVVLDWVQGCDYNTILKVLGLIRTFNTFFKIWKFCNWLILIFNLSVCKWCWQTGLTNEEEDPLRKGAVSPVVDFLNWTKIGKEKRKRKGERSWPFFPGHTHALTTTMDIFPLSVSQHEPSPQVAFCQVTNLLLC